MKTIPYWIETAGVFHDRSGKPLTEDTDLVVVGAGLTGLSTALHSARKGARVIAVTVVTYIIFFIIPADPARAVAGKNPTPEMILRGSCAPAAAP